DLSMDGPCVSPMKRGLSPEGMHGYEPIRVETRDVVEVARVHDEQQNREAPDAAPRIRIPRGDDRQDERRDEDRHQQERLHGWSNPRSAVVPPPRSALYRGAALHIEGGSF